MHKALDHSHPSACWRPFPVALQPWMPAVMPPAKPQAQGNMVFAIAAMILILKLFNSSHERIATQMTRKN